MTSFLSKPKKNFVSELLMKYLYGMTIQATGNNQMPVLNITGHIPIAFVKSKEINASF